MTTGLQVKRVPDEPYDRAQDRAARQGIRLSEYVSALWRLHRAGALALAATGLLDTTLLTTDARLPAAIGGSTLSHR